MIWFVAFLLFALFALQTARQRRSGIKGPNCPTVSGWLPFVGAGFNFIANPRDFFERTRSQVGDTFVVYLFGIRLFCVFSPAGLKSLYSVRESDASFTEATRGLLGLKLPAEVVAEGNLSKFHRGLRKHLLASYVDNVNQAVDDSLGALARTGEFEIFAHMKGLVHKVGFLCWVGPAALNPKYFDRLVATFEKLDPETSFQNLGSLGKTILTRKRGERDAVDALDGLLREIWLEQHGPAEHVDATREAASNLESLHQLYATDPPATRFRKVAHDVFHFHLASQANMYAAMSWTLINVLTKPEADRARVLAEGRHVLASHGPDALRSVDVLENDLKWVECVAQESLRLAQQSITLRKVLRETSFVTEAGTFVLPAGVYVATLLSVTNMDAGPAPSENNGGGDVDDESAAYAPLTEFDPRRYQRGGSALRTGDARFLASTFGHGFHACPGQRFALYILKVVLYKHLLALDMQPAFTSATVPPTSVGAIGRATAPCVVRYKFTK